jgi:uncharacterized membrane protein YbhN (UPF0104 family)
MSAESTSPEDPPPSTPPASRRGGLKAALKAVIAVIIFALLAWYVATNWGDIATAFAGLSALSWWMLTGLLLVVLANDLINSLKFYSIIRLCGERVRVWPCVRIFMISRLMGMLMPQGSTVYRGIALKQQFSIRFRDYASMGIAFVWMNVAISLLLSWIVMLVTQSDIKLFKIDARIVMGLFAIACLVGPLFAAMVFRRLDPRAGSLPDKVIKATGALLRLLNSPILFGVFLGLTVLNFCSSFIFFYVVSEAIGLMPDVAGVVLLIAVIKCGMLVNISPGNAGILEGLSAYTVKQWGGTGVEGFSIALISRAFSLVALIVFAALFGWKEIREMLTSRNAGTEKPSD